MDYSTSQNACVIRYVGGPLDGQQELVDHDHYDAMHFSYPDVRMNAVYKPTGPREYGFSGWYDWDS